MPLRIGITLGDCAGIGPEIVRAALESEVLPTNADFTVVGNYPECTLGQPTLATARAAAAALEEAVTRARGGELDAVVTAPIHKARMYEAGFKFPGQTEFFAERCGVKNFAMLLTGGEMTVALVTRHSSPVFSGPHSPDTVFHRAAVGEFDAVLCMYHDQGLIPLKLQAFYGGVNVTLGLPFPRTSPDHGTAFGIAGKGTARPDSMIAAIKLAVELAKKNHIIRQKNNTKAARS